MRIIISIIIFIAVIPSSAAQKVTTELEVVREVIGRLRKLPAIGYHFQAKAVFPDGGSDSLSGTMYMDSKQQLFFNDNESSVFLLTPQWFYRAEHHKKEITILNLDSYYKKDELKQQVLDELFQGGLATEFLDSILLKHGRVTAFSSEPPLVKLQVQLPPSTYNVKQLEIWYNTALQMPAALIMESIYQVETDKFIQQTIKCTSYTNAPPTGDKLDPKGYFRILDGKVLPVKYKSYKVHSNI